MESEISLCKNCNCMTKTIEGKCGKCGASKTATWEDRFDKVYKHCDTCLYADVVSARSSHCAKFPCGYGLKNETYYNKIKAIIRAEIAAAERRGFDKAEKLAKTIQKVLEEESCGEDCDFKQCKICELYDLKCALKEYEEAAK